MNDLIKDPKTKKEIDKMVNRFIRDLIEKPEDVSTIVDNFYPDLFQIFDVDMKIITESFKNADNDIRAHFINKLTNLKTLVLMLNYKSYDNDISSKVDELFNLCEVKDIEKLKKLFEKSRLELLKKLESSFKRTWRMIEKEKLPEENVIDHRIRMIKSLSEGIYKQLLTVIQEMMQIAFDYKPVKSFGNIIQQIENAPGEFNVFINRTAYNIRNSESHENIELEKDKVILLDEHGKVIQELDRKDLEDTIKWIADFIMIFVHSLQNNYFKMISIKPDFEDRMSYLLKVMLDF